MGQVADRLPTNKWQILYMNQTSQTGLLMELRRSEGDVGRNPMIRPVTVSHASDLVLRKQSQVNSLSLGPACSV